MTTPLEQLDDKVNPMNQSEQTTNISFQHVVEETLGFRYLNQQGGAILEVKSSSKVITPGGAIREPSETFIIRGDAVNEFTSILKMLRTTLSNTIQKQEELGKAQLLKQLAETKEMKNKTAQTELTVKPGEADEEKLDEPEAG